MDEFARTDAWQTRQIIVLQDKLQAINAALAAANTDRLELHHQMDTWTDWLDAQQHADKALQTLIRRRNR